MTQRGVAREMDWSLSKLIRIESGIVNISTNDLRALLRHYGVTEPARIDELVAMARAARRPSDWDIYKDVVSSEFRTYLAHESAATVIRGFESFAVPGLLQTADYARAVMAGAAISLEEDRLQKRLELRLDRQELLLGSDGPKLFFIVDEAVIRRAVGGPGVMREQLRHLLDLIHSEAATIYVVPFVAGFYPLLRWPTILLEFADPDEPYLLYVERPEGERLTREDAHGSDVVGSPAAYLDAFFEAENLALDQSTTALIEQALGTLERP
ncbi:hypothetical protein GCM10009539_77030 [Cryptosporangium japonicum]|uniref:HTH cro/C1-type domain-containing protein n=2 Tax=Cryptosporangium japonicum TaxID=80872 RepID=A0ABP3ETC6_9ACTN